MTVSHQKPRKLDDNESDLIVGGMIAENQVALRNIKSQKTVRANPLKVDNSDNAAKPFGNALSSRLLSSD